MLSLYILYNWKTLRAPVFEDFKIFLNLESSILNIFVKSQELRQLVCYRSSAITQCNISMYVSGWIQDFLRKGAKPSSGSQKQGVWGHSPSKAIGCWVFEVPKSKVQSTFDGFLKDANKCMYLIRLKLLCFHFYLYSLSNIYTHS